MGYRLSVMGYRLWVVGYRLSVFSYRFSVIGFRPSPLVRLGMTAQDDRLGLAVIGYMFCVIG